MEKSVSQIIGTNIKALRLSLGLSQIKFAIATKLSRASIVNIESGKTGYNLNLLDPILDFLNMGLEDLTKSNLTLPYGFRAELEKHHRNNPEVHPFLSEQPPLVYAVKQVLLKSDLLDMPREIHEISSFFTSLGWKYRGTSIQNTLKRLPAQIAIQPHPAKRNTFIYRKK